MIKDKEKREVLKDFQEWSGGWMPHECQEDEVRVYLRTSLSDDFRYRRRTEIRRWMIDMCTARELSGDNEKFKDVVIKG